MNDYISRAKDLCNHLSAASDPISPRDWIMYLFSGLNFDYSSLITTLTYKKEMPSLEEVFTMREYMNKKCRGCNCLFQSYSGKLCKTVT